MNCVLPREARMQKKKIKIGQKLWSKNSIFKILQEIEQNVITRELYTFFFIQADFSIAGGGLTKNN